MSDTSDTADDRPAPPSPGGAGLPSDRQAWYRGTTPQDVHNLDRFFASPLAQRWSEYQDSAAQALPKVGAGARGLTLSWLATEPQAREAVPEVVALIDGYGRKTTFAFPYLLQAFLQMPRERWKPAREATLQLCRQAQSNAASRYTVDGLPTLQFFGELPNPAAMHKQGAFVADMMSRARPLASQTNDRGHAFVVEALLNSLSLVDANDRAELVDVIRWSLDIDGRLGTTASENADTPYPYDVLLERVRAAAAIVEAHRGPHQVARARRFVEDSPNLIAPQRHEGRKVFTQLLTTLARFRSDEEFLDFFMAQREMENSRAFNSVPVLEAAVRECNRASPTCGPLSRQAIVRDAARLWTAMQERDGRSASSEDRVLMVMVLANVPVEKRAPKLLQALRRVESGWILAYILREILA